MHKNHGLKSVLALAAVFVAGQVSATSILSSYPVGTEGSGFAFSASSWESFGFRTGPTNSYSLDSVTMRLSGAHAGLVNVSLFSGTTRSRPCGWSLESGTSYCNYLAPDRAIGSLVSNVVAAKADYVFHATGDITLLPDTLYWVVFKAAGTESFRYYEHAYSDVPRTGDTGYGFDPWQGLFSSQTDAEPFDFAKSPGFDLNPAPGVFVPGVLGQDWMYHSGLNIYSIDATLLTTSVPEPQSVMLLVCGLALVVGPRRYRRWSSQ